jgi:hypothetical protein
LFGIIRYDVAFVLNEISFKKLVFRRFRRREENQAKRGMAYA